MKARKRTARMGLDLGEIKAFECVARLIYSARGGISPSAPWKARSER